MSYFPGKHEQQEKEKGEDVEKFVWENLSFKPNVITVAYISREKLENNFFCSVIDFPFLYVYINTSACVSFPFCFIPSPYLLSFNTEMCKNKF
jgi:hypothetical protein